MKTIFAILLLTTAVKCSAQDSSDSTFHRWGIASDFYGYFNNSIGLNYRIDPSTTLLVRFNGGIYDLENSSRRNGYLAGTNVGLNFVLFRIQDVALGFYAEGGIKKEFGTSGIRYYSRDSILYSYYHERTATLRAGVMAEYWVTGQLTLSMIHSLRWTNSWIRKTDDDMGPSVRSTLEFDYRYIMLTYYF
jgi:hypothetical protein